MTRTLEHGAEHFAAPPLCVNGVDDAATPQTFVSATAAA